MTNLQKDKITVMRLGGYGYLKIAQELWLSDNTVKSYCRRNGLSTQALKNTILCKQCAKAIAHKPNCKPRLFCSDNCRLKWWNSHPEQVKRRAIYSFVCEYCSSSFESYGNSHRKYCSHGCYINSRFSKDRGVNG